MRSLGTTDPAVIGPYRILGVLGSGGMGRVYLGTSNTGRRVAIKVIRPDLAEDPVFRTRFTREVAAARLVSPLFTAAVVDADTRAAEPWLATTYIEGTALDVRVLNDGPLGAAEVLTLAAGLAEALTSIHGVSLVHRDLKPSNILLDASGPHIIDFGLALSPEHVRMTTSLVFGTPSYMAPERLRGEDAGAPSDIFSLGATLVFASTGRDLVEDGTVYEQVLQIAQGRFDLSDVPPAVRSLIVRCVSFEPRDRPTAAELTRIVVALTSSDQLAAAEAAAVDESRIRGEAPRVTVDPTFHGGERGAGRSPTPDGRRSHTPPSIIRPRGAPRESVDVRAASAGIDGPTEVITPFALSGKRQVTGPVISRRTLIGAGSGVAALVVVGGAVFAAKTLFGGGAKPRVQSLPAVSPDPQPSPSLSGPPSASPSAPASDEPIARGTILWQVESGSTMPSAAGSTGSAGRSTVVTNQGVIITASGTSIVAREWGGSQIWSHTSPEEVNWLWAWGPTLIAANTRKLWLIDVADGSQVQEVDPVAKAAAAGTLPPGDHRILQIGNGIAFSPTQVFLSVGVAIVAVNRTGTIAWVQATSVKQSGEPTAVAGTLLVTQAKHSRTAHINVYDTAANGSHVWGKTYTVPADLVAGPPGGGPGGPPPSGPGGPPSPPPGGFPDGGTDDAWYLVESRVSAGYILARVGQDVRRFGLADGKAGWHVPSETPITAIGLAGGNALVAADRISAYDLPSGNPEWRQQLHGARLGVSVEPAGIVAVAMNAVTFFDPAGGKLWQKSLPAGVTGIPDRVMIAPHVAYLTFQPASAEAGDIAPGPDVIAIALDASARR